MDLSKLIVSSDQRFSTSGSRSKLWYVFFHESIDFSDNYDMKRVSFDKKLNMEQKSLNKLGLRKSIILCKDNCLLSSFL